MQRDNKCRAIRDTAIAALVLLGSSCARFEESGLPGSASSMARNQMMWVTEKPPTFGYYRLTSLSRLYPDLAMFVENKGLPDFLAETTNRGRNYYILYYLDRRQAFASRDRPGQRRALEFAGPYPITDKEYRTLDRYRTIPAPGP
jgi:hypothetical protein